MIASVRGEVLSAGPSWVVVAASDGPGGIGLRVEVPARLAAAQPGTVVALHTHLVVREDALTLFGFETVDELEMFGILLGVSGVGPRSALGVLSELTPAQIAHAVAADDGAPFRKVSGIGPKTAKLIVVQLAGKLDPRMFTDLAPEGAQVAQGSVVVDGLVGLGYTDAQAAQAVQDARDAGAPADEAGLLRAALALLQSSKSRGMGR